GDVVAVAEKALAQLKQASKFANFNDFEAQFTMLADRCGYDAATKVRMLKDKVSKDLRTAMSYQYNTPDRDDWDGWVKLCRGLSKSLDDAAFRNGSNQGSGNSNGNNGGSGNKLKDPDAMEIDRLKINEIDQEVIQARFAAKQCI
ncbi:hypothetical protein N0V85_009929, partial [Neurospora sp. IMI 360204]